MRVSDSVARGFLKKVEEAAPRQAQVPAAFAASMDKLVRFALNDTSFPNAPVIRNLADSSMARILLKRVDLFAKNKDSDLRIEDVIAYDGSSYQIENNFASSKKIYSPVALERMITYINEPGTNGPLYSTDQNERKKKVESALSTFMHVGQQYQESLPGSKYDDVARALVYARSKGYLLENLDRPLVDALRNNGTDGRAGFISYILDIAVKAQNGDIAKAREINLKGFDDLRRLFNNLRAIQTD